MTTTGLAALLGAAAYTLSFAREERGRPWTPLQLVVTKGQVIANGQNHGPFVNGVSCGGDPAAYGLETAHHGPDAGTPGNADGCYQTTGGVPPLQDVSNPALG